MYKRQTLSCAVNKGTSRSNKTVFMDYYRLDKDNIFVPKKRLDEIVEANAENLSLIHILPSLFQIIYSFMVN